jgi:adenine-specific DNA-methyltransferase
MHRTEYITPTIERKLFIDKLLTFSINNNILNKIADNKYYLFDDEIAQGIVFPQDFLDKKRALEFNGIYPVGTGIFGLSNFEKESLNLNSKELELIKPYYTSEQINRYYTDIENNLWLIYTDSSFKYPEKMKNYPNIKNHLDRFSRIFTSDNKPYGLHRCRKEYFFQGEKILSLRKCPDKPCFSYSDFDCYVTQTYFSIKTTRWNLKFLTGVLNSKLIAYWLKEKGKMQGKNYQIDKEPLLSTPLPLISLEGQENIINLVDIIIRNKRENPNVDISENESKIDKLVYQLYGLTDTEIKIIEESV